MRIIYALVCVLLAVGGVGYYLKHKESSVVVVYYWRADSQGNDIDDHPFGPFVFNAGSVHLTSCTDGKDAVYARLGVKVVQEEWSTDNRGHPILKHSCLTYR